MVVVADPPPSLQLGRRMRAGIDLETSYDAMVRDARTGFLRTRRIASSIREEIAMSWRRSLLAGVSATEARPQQNADVNLDCQLARVAAPVLQERHGALVHSGVGVVLTDADACVLSRWGGDPELDAELDHNCVFPGNCFAEWLVGTNSAALAIETGAPCEVHGAEHFAEQYAAFSSAGAPICHPVNRRLLGSLNVVCRSEDASPLLMPWLLEVVRDIERRLLALGSVNEQLLFESYVAAKRDSRRPVVCLNEQTILTNSAAARLLGAVDKALLWEQASRAINERADDVSELMLSDGRLILAHCRPIYDGGVPVGAKIEIELDGQQASTIMKRRDADATTSASLAGLAGSSVVWQRFCEETACAKKDKGPLLLIGEPGSGKLAVATALFPDEKLDVFDAALHEIEPARWIKRLAKRFADERGVIVIQHLEALDESAHRTVSSLIALARDDGPRVVGTMRSDALPWDDFDRVLKLPALRDRLDDLRELVQALAERFALDGAKWQWMPDAIQTLGRLEWPANVRSLESVVKQVVADRRGGYIDSRSLPESVRAAASRRPLSRLEQVEAVAITEALEHARGNKLEAAQSLGIARSTLYRRMRALGIDLSETNY